MPDPEIDNKEIRCPRLGSMIPFKYCLMSGDEDMPCFKVFDCWWEIFDVAGYLKENLPGDLFELLVQNQPKDKLSSIIAITEKVKKT